MEGYLAEVRLFAGNFAPKGWAFCQGQILAISTNTALFSLLGCTYGGDCRNTFALPDLTGRTAIGPGTGAGLSSYTLGEKTGTTQVTLLSSQIPVHDHTVTSNLTATLVPGCSTTASSDEPENNYPAASTIAAYNSQTDGSKMPAIPLTVTGSVQCAVAGNSMPHDNMMPTLVMNYVICMYGLFPSRN